MEKLRKRGFVLAGFFVAAGFFAHMAAPAVAATHDEPWMERTALSKFGGYTMAPGNDPDQSISYKMDKDTYQALNPFGIVCREFVKGDSMFDVVLIASQAKDSFHDPRVCFGAQGWALNDETMVNIPTSRGDFPVTIARINSEDGERWAAFGYRTPYGFADSTNKLKFEMFKYSLLNSRPGDGVFYRFIGMSSDVTRQSLITFIKQYMNASASYSHNYF